MELKNTEKLEKSIVALTIEISAEEIEAGKQQAYKKNGKKITVPGFRKGKAPRKIIENLYGPGVFFEDAINICYPDVFDKAVEAAGIEPVGAADVEISDMTDDGAVVIVAKVPVKPEVKLGEYKGISIEKDEPKVLAADVKAELDRMAHQNARTETVERKAKKNDTVNLDFEGFVDGVAFEGGKGEGHDLTLGSGTFIPGFEDQLIGCAAGDEKDVVVTFPAEYHAEDLAGKEATFECKINSVKETILPTIDDEFAKDVSETCETLDELKKEIKEKLLKSRAELSEREYEDNLMGTVLDSLEADIPDAMIENQLDNVLQDFAYRLQSQGISMEQYAKMTGMEPKAFRDMFRGQAEQQVKTRLALEKIVELEKFEVTEADIEAEYARLAEQYGLEADKVKAAVPAEALTGDIKMTRAMDLIRDTAKPKKKSKKKAEAEAPAEE